MDAALIKSAEEGDSDSQFTLGCKMLEAQGSSSSVAVEWIRRAADQGDRRAHAKLAECFDSGVGVPLDHTEAARHHLLAGERGDPEHQWRAGWLYFQAKAIEQDLVSAARLFLHSAMNRSDELAQRIERLYAHREGVPGNPSGPTYWALTGPSSANDAECLYRAGLLFLLGQGIPRDKSIAFRFLTEACGRGHAQACVTCGREVYENDPTAAIRFFERAADSDPKYQQHACMEGMIATGIAQKKLYDDTEAAIRWFRKAADSNDPEGCFKLGAELAHSCDGREEEAIHWLSTALRLGLSSKLGVLCSWFLADLLYDRGNKSESIAVLERALSIRTDSDAIVLNENPELRDEILSRLDRQWVAEVISKARPPDEDNSHWISYLEEKRKFSALFERPQFPLLLTNLATLYHNAGEHEKAGHVWDLARRAHVPAEVGSDLWQSYQLAFSRAEEKLDSDILIAALRVKEDKSNTSQCFIATACYGYADHPDVLFLREWRDHRLAKTSLGRLLIQSYYLVSPPVAQFLAPNPTATKVVRNVFLQPFTNVLRALTRRQR